jgi:hypothetical protein
MQHQHAQQVREHPPGDRHRQLHRAREVGLGRRPGRCCCANMISCSGPHVARHFLTRRCSVRSCRSGMLLDLADAFRCLVLCAAIERRHGLDAAFMLLDQASLLKSRNHHRVLRRELDRVRALIEAVPGAR